MNRFLPAFLILLFSTVAGAQSHDDSPFVPLKDSPYPYTIEKVQNFWIASLPRLVPPSAMRQGYAYDMAAYNTKLRERNQWIARVRAGEFDDRAECAMLKHNARLADRLRKPQEAARLRARLQRLQEGSATVAELNELRAIVQQQCAAIELLKKEVEILNLKLEKLR